MRKAVLIIIAALLLFSTGGCTKTGAHELDQRAYVLSIGVDKGVSDKFRYTFQFPTLSGGKQAQNTSGETMKSITGSQLSTITIDCPTVHAGIELLFSSFSRRLTFNHALYLIISEELAREGVAAFLSDIIGGADVRRTMYVIVVKGKASEFINEFNPFAGSSVSKSQEMIMRNAELSGLYESMVFNEFLSRLKCTKCQVTATLAALSDFSDFKEDGTQTDDFISEGDYYPGRVPRVSGNRFDFLGTAIFNGATMVGELNGNETRSMLMLQGDFKQSEIVIPDPQTPALRVGATVFQQKRPEITIRFEDGRAKIHAAVFLEAALQNAQNTSALDMAQLRQIEGAYQSFIKEKLDQTVQKCQELNCDVFDFGFVAARQFWTIQEWEAYDWLTNFKNAEVTTEVSFIIRRTGTLISAEAEKKAENGG